MVHMGLCRGTEGRIRRAFQDSLHTPRRAAAAAAAELLLEASCVRACCCQRSAAAAAAPAGPFWSKHPRPGKGDAACVQQTLTCLWLRTIWPLQTPVAPTAPRACQQRDAAMPTACTRGFLFVPQIEQLAICSLQCTTVPQAALDCMADPADSFLFIEPCITTQADPAVLNLAFLTRMQLHHNRNLLVSSFLATRHVTQSNLLTLAAQAQPALQELRRTQHHQRPAHSTQQAIDARPQAGAVSCSVGGTGSHPIGTAKQLCGLLSSRTAGTAAEEPAEQAPAVRALPGTSHIPPLAAGTAGQTAEQRRWPSARQRAQQRPAAPPGQGMAAGRDRRHRREQRRAVPQGTVPRARAAAAMPVPAAARPAAAHTLRAAGSRRGRSQAEQRGEHPSQGRRHSSHAAPGGHPSQAAGRPSQGVGRQARACSGVGRLRRGESESRSGRGMSGADGWALA